MGYEKVFDYLLKRQAYLSNNVIPSASVPNTPPGFSDIGKWSVAEFNNVYTASGGFTAYADSPSTSSVTVPETTVNNFMFHVNGDYVDVDAFKIEQSGSIFKLWIHQPSMSYTLESTDEVYSWGRFEN